MVVDYLFRPKNAVRRIYEAKTRCLAAGWKKIMQKEILQIELSEKYFEMAKKRINNQQKPML